MSFLLFEPTTCDASSLTLTHAIWCRLVDALPDAIGSLDTIVAETQEYSKVVAVPPYFAGSLPRVPTRTFYDISMEPGAAPLQFVKFPLDGYIPKIYNAVTFENGAELGDLYGDALEFFE